MCTSGSAAPDDIDSSFRSAGQRSRDRQARTPSFQFVRAPHQRQKTPENALKQNPPSPMPPEARPRRKAEHGDEVIILIANTRSHFGSGRS